MALDAGTTYADEAVGGSEDFFSNLGFGADEDRVHIAHEVEDLGGRRAVGFDDLIAGLGFKEGDPAR